MAKHFKTDPTVRSEIVTVQGGEIHAVAEGASIVVTREPQEVGRAPHCPLVLQDPAVSAVHLQVRATPNGTHVVDLGSRNGTFLHGQRIVEAYLLKATDFECAGSRLRFTPTAPVDVPLGAETTFGALVGRSPSMLQTFETLRKFAPSDLAVLVTGETGTGKELAARAIHDASLRSAGPFVAFNCSAIQDSVLEDELFGHVKGAFTGADRERKGLFVEADGGTLFLDEIGDMSPAMQVKILRALEAKEVRPVGADRTRRVDVRVVVATHVDLRRAINKGAFREDLFYRVARVHVVLPPLRDRPEDMPFLAKHLVGVLGRPDVSIHPDALARLVRHDWPGNVRELRNVLDRALVGLEGAVLSDVDVLPPGAKARSSVASAVSAVAPADRRRKWSDVQDETLRRYLTELHAACRGNVSQIARASGIARTTVRTKLREFGLDAAANGAVDEGGPDADG